MEEMTDSVGTGGAMKPNRFVATTQYAFVGDHKIRGQAVSKRVNRLNERIAPGAIQLEHFNVNPVLVWNHNWGSPPIGRVLSFTETEDGWDFEAEFDQGDEFAVSIERKYREGFLNAFSIGFLAHDRQYHEGADGRMIGVIHEAELLELSAVLLPADPGAMQSQNLAFYSLGDMLVPEQYRQTPALDRFIEREAARNRAAEPETSWSKQIRRMQHLVAELRKARPENGLSLTDVASLRELIGRSADILTQDRDPIISQAIEVLASRLGEDGDEGVWVELDKLVGSRMPERLSSQTVQRLDDLRTRVTRALAQSKGGAKS